MRRAAAITGWMLLVACSGSSGPPDAAPLLTVTPLAGARTTSTPAGIDCGDGSPNICAAPFVFGTHVALTVTPQTTLPCFTFTCEMIEPPTAGIGCSDILVDGPVSLKIGCVR